MFVVASKFIFWWPVTVEKPSIEKPGEFDRFPLKLQFEQIPVDEALAEQAEISKLSPDERRKPANSFVFRRIKGWDDVTDAQKHPLPFSPVALTAAWNDLHFRKAAEDAYEAALSGEKARLGN